VRGRRSTVRKVQYLGGETVEHSSTTTDEFVAATIAAYAVPTTAFRIPSGSQPVAADCVDAVETAPPTTDDAAAMAQDLVATTRNVAIASRGRRRAPLSLRTATGVALRRTLTVRVRDARTP
jgi:hypothetical protein